MKLNNKHYDKDSTKYLYYYAFDWDDNIIHMPTIIHMEHLIDGKWVAEDVSTDMYAVIRKDNTNWRPINNNSYESLLEFRDTGKRGDNAFIEDCIISIKNKDFGPSWKDFISCIKNGSIFAIITARGHMSITLRKAIEYIINNVMTDDDIDMMYNNLIKFNYLFNKPFNGSRILTGIPSKNPLVKSYLDECVFAAVMSPEYKGDAKNPEQLKAEVLTRFIEKMNNFAKSIGKKAIIGFSDDDLGNISYIEKLFDNIDNEQFPHVISCVLKNTNDKDNIIRKTRSMTENHHILDFNNYIRWSKK